MLKKIILLISCILILSVQGECQHRIGEFMAYGSNSGLPASFYYAVVQSTDGYLWIGSSSGLIRFDGKNYKTYFSDFADDHTISDNVVNDLVEDNEGNLWIAGLYQGVSKLNLRSGRIKRYSKLSEDENPQYGIHQIVKDVDGEIWIGTSGRGLAHYLPDEDRFEFFIPDPHHPADGSNNRTNHVSGIAIDHSDPDILWLSCYQGVYSFHKKTKEFRGYRFYYPLEKAPAPFLCIETDQSDKIWLGTWYYGLVSFDKKTHQFKTHTYPQAHQLNNLHYLVLDIKSINDSTLYLASGNSGLLSFHKDDHRIVPLLTNDLLPRGSSDIDIQRISLTANAGLFVGGNYFVYQKHPSFNRFSQSVYFPYGNHFGVYEIVFDETKDGYWLACQNAGEVLFLDREMKVRTGFRSENELSDQFLDVAIDHKDRIWVVSNNSGILMLDEDSKQFKKVKIFLDPNVVSDPIRNIEASGDGNLWLLNTTTLFYFNILTNTLERFPMVKDGQKSLQDLTLCSGLFDDAWVGCGQGLFHFIRSTGEMKHIVPDPPKRDALANWYIKSMTIDKQGNAWLGFESDGIQVMRASDHTVLTTFNLDDGLPGMQINYMSTDTAGGIWAGTAAGLAFYDPNADIKVWQLFNRQDGVQRDYIDRPIMATDDGKLFFNIEEGISWIDAGVRVSSKNEGPRFHLIGFDIDGKPFREDILPEYLTSVELPYSVNEIKVEYAAMDYIHPGRTKYFYRIEGISAPGEWIENKQATILLTGMKPGEYTVQLYAVDGEGRKSEEFSLPMTIHPPFWHRWWFVSLVALALLSLAYAIYQYRIGQLHKIQMMRNIISTNLHDDIGASLSNIHILTVLTQRNLSNPGNASTYIAKAGDEIQRISESLSDIVWNISPRNDDLDNLFVRMKRYAADMLEGNDIHAEFVFPEYAEKISLPMDQRRDFYLIFKEAVNNLVKYSQASEALIKVTVDHHVLRMEIRDHGQGFDPHLASTGNGIQNMKERADKWGAALSVVSVPGEGTRIVLDMKVN